MDIRQIAEHIRKWEIWKKYDWLFWILFVLCTFAVLIKSKSLAHVIYIPFIGLFAAIVLYRITKPWFLWIWRSGIGKIGVAFFSFVVVAIARVLADYQIVTTTAAPASLFPRAQDVLTLLFSLLMWYNVSLLLMAVLVLVSQFVLWILSLFREDVEYRSIKDRGVLIGKLVLSWMMLLGTMVVVDEAIKRMRFTITEHALVWSSFVENSAIPLHLTPPPLGPRPAGYPEALHHCRRQPKDAWVAFVTGDNVKDDEVMVALPSEGTRNAFTFVWGKCGAANRTVDEER